MTWISGTRSNAQAAPVSPSQSAMCGSVAGGIAASITTPLDVAKTRLMLGKDLQGVEYKGMINTLFRVYGDATCHPSREFNSIRL